MCCLWLTLNIFIKRCKKELNAYKHPVSKAPNLIKYKVATKAQNQIKHKVPPKAPNQIKNDVTS